MRNYNVGEILIQKGYNEFSMIFEFIGSKDVIVASRFRWNYEVKKSCNQSGESIGLFVIFHLKLKQTSD